MKYKVLFSLLMLATAVAGTPGHVHGALIQHFWDFEGPDTYADKVNSADLTVTDNTNVTTGTGHDGNTAAVLPQLLSKPADPDESDDFLTVGATKANDPGTESFSLSLWMNMTSDSPASGSNIRGIADFNGNSTTTGFQLLYVDDAGGDRLVFRVDNAPNSAAAVANYTDVTFDDASWHFVVATFNTTTGVANLFVDGSTVDATATMTSATIEVDFHPLQVFGGYNAEGALTDIPRGLNGSIDDIAIYHGVLNTDQIDGLFAGTVSPAMIPEPSSMAIIAVGLLLTRLHRPR